MQFFSLRYAAISIGFAFILACGDGGPSQAEYVASGDRFVAEEKYREAVIEYRNAIQQDPQFGEARLKLGDAYMKLDQPLNALGEYVRAADLLPQSVDAQMRAGQLLLTARRFLDAQARAEKALALAPNNVDALILKANALGGLNRVDEAIAELEEGIRNAPANAAVSYATLGDMQMAKGDVEEARQAFEKAVESDPKSVVARLSLGTFYWRLQNRRADAEAQFKAALQLDPKSQMANRALAVFSMANRDLSAAESYIRTVTGLATQDSERFALGDFYAANQRMEDARREYQALASGQSIQVVAAAKLRLAGLDVTAGNAADARRLVDEVIAADPRNAEALSARAQLLANGEDLTNALSSASAATSANPRSSRAHYTLGKIQAGRGNIAEAIASLTESVNINRQFAPARYELARLLFDAGRMDEAREHAAMALRLNPTDRNSVLLFARVSLVGGRVADADRVLRPLAVALPNDLAVQTELGLVELARQNRPAARTAFERVLVRDPAQADAVSALAKLHVDDGRPALARQVLDTALRTSPQDGALMLTASHAYLAMGAQKEGEDMLRRLVQADPGNLDANSTLAGLFASQGRVAEAQAEYERLVQQDPQSVGALTQLGVLFDLQGRKEDARRRYERALEIDPQAAVAANNLAWRYAEDGGNLDVALQLAQTAKARLPNSGDVSDTLGWIYVKKGLGSLAVTALSDAVRQSPASASFHYHLGAAYAATGDKMRARGSLEKALSISRTFDGAADAQRLLASLN